MEHFLFYLTVFVITPSLHHFISWGIKEEHLIDLKTVSDMVV